MLLDFFIVVFNEHEDEIFLVYAIKFFIGFHMKPKVIGIIGGAGPFAGARLFERILTLSNLRYGCYRDADYPQVLLISFPFSEMLTFERNETQLKKELNQCINLLCQLGAEVLAIACNTLHNFLDQDHEALIQLPRVMEKELFVEEIPLVLCTSTSRNYNMHRKFFMCQYPEDIIQEKLDGIIDRILRGSETLAIVNDLLEIIEEEASSVVVLGCTELSLFAKELSVRSKKIIIDPLDVLAEKLLERSFENRSEK